MKSNIKAIVKFNIDRPIIDMGEGDVFSIRQLLIGAYFAIVFAFLCVNVDSSSILVQVSYYGFLVVNLWNVTRLFNKYDKDHDKPSND